MNSSLSTVSTADGLPTLEPGRATGTYIDPSGRLFVIARLEDGTTTAILARSMPTTASRHAPAVAASGIIKASPGILWTIYAHCNLLADLWLMTFDATSLPPDGTAPVDVVQVPRQDNGQAFMEPTLSHTSGIVWAASTTRDTLTVHTGTPFLVRARYQ